MKKCIWTIAICLTVAHLGWAQAAETPKGGAATKPAVEKPAADKPAVKKEIISARTEQKTAAWLGIRLNLVPPPLAKHLGLEGGLMVGNVITGSPADKAGLQRYDIVTSVDGQPVKAEPESLVQSIRHKKPGDPVRLEVIRKGHQKEVQAMLDKAPASLEAMALKYPDDDPDLQWTDKLNFRTRVMGVGPDGKMILVNPKEMMPEIQGILRALPGAGADCDVTVNVVGNKNVTKIVRSEDGKKLEIQQGEDGQITVTRSAPNSPAVTKTYKSPEELAKGDAEAAELLKGTTVHVIVGGEGGFHRLPGVGPDFEKKMKEFREKAKKEMEEAREKAEKMGAEARKRAEEIAKDIRVEVDAQGHKIRKHMAQAMGEVVREFKIAEDGKIEVLIRKGGDQVSMTFKNEQEFKQKEPKLYEEFKKAKE